MSRFRTLTSRLVLTAVALVALASLLIGTATALAMRSYLTDQLDHDVRATVERTYGGPGPGRPDDERPMVDGMQPGAGHADRDRRRSRRRGRPGRGRSAETSTPSRRGRSTSWSSSRSTATCTPCGCPTPAASGSAPSTWVRT